MSLAKYLAKGGEELGPLLAKLKASKMGQMAAEHPGATAALAGGAGMGAGALADEAMSDDDDPLTKILKKIGLA